MFLRGDHPRCGTPLDGLNTYDFHCEGFNLIKNDALTVSFVRELEGANDGMQGHPLPIPLVALDFLDTLHGNFACISRCLRSKWIEGEWGRIIIGAGFVVICRVGRGGRSKTAPFSFIALLSSGICFVQLSRHSVRWPSEIMYRRVIQRR